MPFSYLGVPLSTKRFSMVQCQPLLDNILGRITTWAVKLQTYAGKVQLTKNVLFYIQTFFSKSLFFPKNVLNTLTTTCTKYVWIGKADNINKSPIEWEWLCKPKVAVGLHMIDVDQWIRLL